jgi:hypothetical protein
VTNVSPGLLTFAVLLNGQKNGSHYMPFDMPMVWKEPNNCSSDCYFCLTDISEISSKSKHIVTYPNLPSAMRCFPHCDELPVSEPPGIVTMDKDNSDADEVHPDQVGEQCNSDPAFEQSGPSSKLHFLSQADLNDLIWD